MENEAHRARGERVQSLSHPDTLIAFEYFSHVWKKGFLEPEKRLMLAVLEDAVHCFRRYVVKEKKSGKEQSREAEKWIWEEKEEWLFSYKNICNEVGLDPNGTRSKLMQWKRIGDVRWGKKEIAVFHRGVRNEVKGGPRPTDHGKPRAAAR